jgi:hypothetical protein
MPSHNVDSDSPFTNDSSHGISRDAIVFRLNSLERGQSRTFEKLEEITLLIAKMPSGRCPQADQCAEMRETVEQMKLDNAKQAGAKTVLVMVGSVLGSLITMVVPYLFTKGK